MVRLVPTLVTKVARSTGTAHPRADSAGRHEVKFRKSAGVFTRPVTSPFARPRAVTCAPLTVELDSRPLRALLPGAPG
jgi:hypothetical protein